jgi:hypothetical protein
MKDYQTHLEKLRADAAEMRPDPRPSYEPSETGIV